MAYRSDDNNPHDHAALCPSFMPLIDDPDLEHRVSTGIEQPSWPQDVIHDHTVTYDTTVGIIDSSNGNSNNDDGYGNGGPSPEDDVLKCQEQPPAPLNYACLLYRLDPEKYKHCENCTLPSWPRALQHLKRAHVAGQHHCPTCRLSFSSEELKNKHIRQGKCRSTNLSQCRVLLEEDYISLKYLREDSDEEKWKAAWNKLFPRLQTPSPFSESQIESIVRTGPDICLAFLQQAADGHENLPCLANELVNVLTRPPKPAARGGDVDTASTGRATMFHNGNVYSPDLSDQATQATYSLLQPRPLPESNSWIIKAPQASPDAILHSQQRMFAQSQQIWPDVSLGFEHRYGPFVPEISRAEAIQDELATQSSRSMTLRVPQGSENLSSTGFGGTISDQDDLQSNVFLRETDAVVYLAEDMISSHSFSERGDGDSFTFS
ncbi:hypothetical protein NM208_g581 [Fusarium decemcellulare]|uniref:Uncharacterized protein n=1 Tax=Fusarium decemcellulare TaxID=57161 RepID=A0ACC1SYV9_9HYPO|nr:hypothetical protein NM208_g581 [Fusarium decemcellulare]